MTPSDLMSKAARAALAWSNADVEATVAKTHSGLITAFSLHLVKTGRLSVELGKALNQVHRIRLIADYTGDEVTIDAAQLAVDQASRFVETIKGMIADGASDDNPD